MPTILMASEASVARARARNRRPGSLVKRLVTSLALTLMIAFAFALAIQAVASAPSRDPSLRMERADRLLRSLPARN